MPIVKLEGADHIYQRHAVDGRVTSYQVKIRRRPFPAQIASFRELDEARRFVRQALAAQDRGHKVDHLIASRTSVGEVIGDAIARIDSGRRRAKGVDTERIRLVAFRRDFHELCSLMLSEVSEEKFEDWIAERLEVVKSNTVLREYRLLKSIFAAASRRYDLRRSPLEYVKPPSIIDERILRISADEEYYLFAELERAKDAVVPLAARFALETGCRRGEQLRLRWEDYDPIGGTVWLADAKNGRGRYVILTRAAQTILDGMAETAVSGRIFEATGNLLRKAFEYTRSRAARRAVGDGKPHLLSIVTVRWHDMRHEAISRCFDASWTSEEVIGVA